jgi:hypothetical protein
MSDFIGGTPLSTGGCDAAQAAVRIPPAALWAVISTETSGAGFLPDRRPKILFERHIFSRLTGGRYDGRAPDISAPSIGGYGPSGAHQYQRLRAAMQLDEEAALQSASWGLGQILGANFTAAGHADVRAMVDAFVQSEDAQLLGMVRFIQASGMDGALRERDWAGFARRYNGPDYAAHHYDDHLLRFYQQYSDGPSPNLTIRAAQLLLTYRGQLLAIDGVAGPATVAAVKAFQASIGVAADGVIDAALLARLAI